MRQWQQHRETLTEVYLSYYDLAGIFGKLCYSYKLKGDTDSTDIVIREIVPTKLSNPHPIGLTLSNTADLWSSKKSKFAGKEIFCCGVDHALALNSAYFNLYETRYEYLFPICPNDISRMRGATSSSFFDTNSSKLIAL
jgi:hypothetical protein